MTVSFREMESACEMAFQSFGPTFHICSSENFEIIFRDDKDFRAGMGILAICSKLFPKIKIYTFQLMNNHFHIVLSGPIDEIEEFLQLFKCRLQKHFENKDGRLLPLTKMEVHTFPIGNLEYFRAAVAYNNRNGFVVNEKYSPYSYPWGANNCFYNTTLRNYYLSCRKYVSTTQIRSLIHSKMADEIKDLFSIDDCVSPLSFCDIDAVERIFRNEKQYFYFLSKKLETYGEIAKDIGEMLFFTDEDLYQIVRSKSLDMFGIKNPSLLDNESKIQVARLLHNSYNAGNKQIQRILKIDQNILNSMF